MELDSELTKLQMLNALIHAPLSFFETTPSGRCDSRFHSLMWFNVYPGFSTYSRETSTSSIKSLPGVFENSESFYQADIEYRVIQGMFRTTATCLGIIIVVAIVFPVFLVVVPPLAYFYSRVMTFVATFFSTCVGPC